MDNKLATRLASESDDLEVFLRQQFNLFTLGYGIKLPFPLYGSSRLSDVHEDDERRGFGQNHLPENLQGSRVDCWGKSGREVHPAWKHL